MATLIRRPAAARFPDMLDWLEAPWASLLPFAPDQGFRVEDYTEDGRHVVRAELPGLDPESDVEVTVADGVLAIHAERHVEHKEDRRTEFRYGSLTRSVSLPPGTDPEKVTATYDKGILEVTIPLPESKREAHHVPVTGA